MESNADEIPGLFDKDHPSAAWIASLRRRFPVERAVDRVLTRKLERRAGPGYVPATLPVLIDGVASLIRARVGTPFRITDARWLSGGASKLQMAFTLDWERPGVGPEKTAMVLRMQPAESIVETSRLREFQLLRAVDGVVPVPPVYWCDEDGEHLPYPALVYGLMPGSAKPRVTVRSVSGIGIVLQPALRAQLAPQFVEHLARIHTLDCRQADLGAFDAPEPGTQCAAWGVGWWERVWEEDADEDIPLLRLAAAWLRRRLPVLDRPSIVHADYRLGNFLFTEDDARITAWLDWELGRLGDPHQDIAWTTSRAFAGLDEDGKTELVCGLLPEPDFLEAYERAANRRIEPRTLHWYKVYNNYSLAVLLIGTAYRVARNAKTHQDVLVAWVIGLGYRVLDQMRAQMEEGA
jgi:aminoglycoside phosphotransferase (APT) family kinase protein